MKNQKKILIVSFEFPPVVGGAGVYAHDLAIGFSKNNQLVDVLTFSIPGTERVQKELLDNYKINLIKFKRNIFFVLKTIFFFLFRVNYRNYNSIILSDGVSKKLFSILFIFKPSLTKITSTVFHGNEINTLFKSPSFIVKVFKLDYFLIKLLHKLKSIIVVSYKEKDIWETQFPQLKNKIKLVLHGVNQDYFYNIPQSSSLYNELGLSSNYKYIVSISRIDKKKGQDFLIEAFQMINKIKKDYKLIIVGSGPYLNTLKLKVENLNLQNEVIFIGAIKRKDLILYYNISEFFVLVSRYTEAFGLVYIEAAACGKASISGNIGGVVNAVEHQSTGLNVNSLSVMEIYEAILLLIQDEKLLKKLSSNALINYKLNFTESKMALNTLEVINDY